jgi:hypothetical protein
MIEVATASLNTLPYPAVSPILNQLLAELQSLRSEVTQLREERDRDREEIEALKVKLACQEATELQDINRICIDIAQDRQRISKLEFKEPQPTQKDRGEILRALLVANGGKMLAKDARRTMRLRKELFSMLLRSMEEYIEIKPSHSDKRKKLLILK